MDGYDTHRVSAAGRCDFGVGLFPMPQESAQVVASRGDPVLQIIHKGLDIGDIGLEKGGIRLLKAAQDSFRQVCQGMVMRRNGELQFPGEESGHGGLFRILRPFHQGHLRHQAPHHDRRLDKKGVVRHHRDAGLYQGGGDLRSPFVVPDQDGHPAPGNTPLRQAGQGGKDLLHLVFGEADRHLSGSRVAEFRGLGDIGIEGLQQRILSQVFVQFFGREVEKIVVERHNCAARAEIAVQGGDLRLPGREFLLQCAAQQFPVASPPAVDRLFDISHHQGVEAGSFAVMEQGAEIVPLDAGRVLEFVQEEILEANPQFLVHERGVGPVDDSVQDGIGIFQGKDVPLFLDPDQGLPQFPGHAQAVKLALQLPGRHVFLVRGAEKGAEIVQGPIQHTFQLHAQVVFGLGEPFGRVLRLGQESRREVLDSGRRVCRYVIIQGREEMIVGLTRFYPAAGQHVQDLLGGRLHPQGEILAKGGTTRVQGFQTLPGKREVCARIRLQALPHFLELPVQGQAPAVFQMGLHPFGEPVQQGAVFLCEVVQDPVHPFFHQRLVVQLDLIGRELADFPGERPQGLLEKAVYGGDGEGGIVVQDTGKLGPGPLPQGFQVRQQGGDKIVLIRGTLRFPGQQGQFREDSAFHLVRGLVGESDSQYMPIGIRPGGCHQQPDIFPGQVVCLAGPCRRLEYFKHGIQIYMIS